MSGGDGHAGRVRAVTSGLRALMRGGDAQRGAATPMSDKARSVPATDGRGATTGGGAMNGRRATVTCDGTFE